MFKVSSSSTEEKKAKFYCQLVGSRKITGSVHVNEQLLTVWNNFGSLYLFPMYKEALPKGASDSLTGACSHTVIKVLFTEGVDEPRDVAKIVVNHCYQFICGGEPSWDITDNILSEDRKLKIQEICLSLKKLLPTKVTFVTLSKSPESFIPFLAFILLSYESVNEDSEENSLKKKHQMKNAISYKEQLDVFCRVLNFDKLRISSHDLIPNENNTVLFGLLIWSNGFDVDCVVYRRRKEGKNSNIGKLQPQLTDFNSEEVESVFRPVFLDPGRKAVFTAMDVLDREKHNILRCTTKEYCHLTGSPLYQKRLLRRKQENGVEAIETGTPTTKTADVNTYRNHIQHIFSHLNVLLNFYVFDTTKDRFFYIKEDSELLKRW
ncbi:hypothetical protein INT47_006432 [Mucor saturninus]|uniref:Uncharacterized protein n=1 Tax=Mucor saturninus TaxID=64648 RepID=A0A8H7UT48_9FUNG|nr:hypothetical protein INT47_006432 [Mucor saturninus]